MLFEIDLEIDFSVFRKVSLVSRGPLLSLRILAWLCPSHL